MNPPSWNLKISSYIPEGDNNMQAHGSGSEISSAASWSHPQTPDHQKKKN